jgi:hypothetical protein
MVDDQRRGRRPDGEVAAPHSQHLAKAVSRHACGDRHGLGQDRASLPRHQMPVRLCEDALLGADQKPRPTLYPRRALQPVSGAAEADGMKTSLSKTGMPPQTRSKNRKAGDLGPNVASPQRFGSHLGEAAAIEQASLALTQNLMSTC